MLKRIKVRDNYFEELYSYEQITARIDLLSEELNAKNISNPIFLVVLKGAFLFAAELIKRYEGKCSVNFIQTSSYKGMESSGKLFTTNNTGYENIAGRDLVLIEDIVDTGRTIVAIRKELDSLDIKSLLLVSLVDKPEARLHPVEVDLVGFTIPNRFIIGFGLDYDQQGRNLKSLYLKAE